MGSRASDDAADALIIGAGPSGAVVAKVLCDAGWRVVCLEQGDWPDRAEYPGASREWELLAATQWSPKPGIRAAPGDYPVEESESEISVLNFNGVGGGTVLYNAQWPRMLPDDFRVRSVDGVADDWPIGYADLQPYYESTERDLGVSGLGGNPAYPPGADPPLPALPIGQAGLLVARAHARLGWHWWPATNAIASAPYRGRNPCVRRGTCGSGCNEGAKASADVTHWADLAARGVRVVTGATVQRIVVDEQRRATGAEWIGRDGTAHFQAADVVVCAANAIGTARLLLASATPEQPNGLANSSGLLGRRLMMHPLTLVTGLFDEPLEGWRAQSGALIHSLQFADSDHRRGFVRGATWALGTAGGPLKALYSPDGHGRWGPAHHRHVIERFGRSASWVIIAEDLPDPENRVELSATMRDPSGLPAPRVTYRVGDNTARLTAWHAQQAARSLTEAGARSVETQALHANGHFLGTARMGTDPRTSVVDADCVAHDVRNLLVVDGSVFVTAGSANPTSTIVAIAQRAAQRLAARQRPAARLEITPWTRHDPAAVVRLPQPPPVEASLSDAEASLIARICDGLIPGEGVMPPASEVVDRSSIARVLRARPDQIEPVRSQLAEIPVDIDPARLRHDAALAPLRYVIAAAYYLDERVRAALGYRPEPATPVTVRAYPEFLDEGLLEHLVAAH